MIVFPPHLQPPDPVEQSSDRNGTDLFTQGKRMFPGMNHVQNIQMEIGAWKQEAAG